MSKIEHTPGPWRTDQKYPGVVIGGADEHGRPCQVASATLNGFRTVEEQHANARVIAAAPDLLEAAELLEKAELGRQDCDECEGDDEPEKCGTCFPKFDDARIKRRIAIAKAVG